MAVHVHICSCTTHRCSGVAHNCSCCIVPSSLLPDTPGSPVCAAEGPEPLPAYIFCLAQHPDGNTFATSCSDGVLRVWALADDKLSLLHELGLHQTLGTASAFSTDGKLLFSASKNGDFVLMVSLCNDAAVASSLPQYCCL